MSDESPLEQRIPPWCPVCGCLWRVKGCTPDRCNDTGFMAEHRRRLAREGVVVPPVVGTTGDMGPLVATPRLTPEELLRRTEPPVAHSPPWRFVKGHWDIRALTDGNDRVLLDAGSAGDVHVLNARVAALIEAAPEMEALLSDLEEPWPGQPPEPCFVCHVVGADRFASPEDVGRSRVPHAPDCKLANLLDRIDRAGRGG